MTNERFATLQENLPRHIEDAANGNYSERQYNRRLLEVEFAELVAEITRLKG